VGRGDRHLRPPVHADASRRLAAARDIGGYGRRGLQCVTARSAPRGELRPSRWRGDAQASWRTSARTCRPWPCGTRVRHSTRITVGPVRFRIGSDWGAPIAALETLYAAYPEDPARPADATVRLFAARPWRRWLRPSVHIGGDFVVPDALPLPLSMGLLAAEMGMNLQVALGWRRHLLLHASAAAREGKSVLMSGISGSGK